MRENGFRAFLTPRLSGASVSSYLSNARAVERRLAIDLDEADLGDAGIDAVRARLVDRGMAHARAGDCASALRQYEAFRSAAPPGTVALPQPSPSPSPLAGTATAQLLRTYAAVIGELRHRGIVRTANGPVGDYAEHLFSLAFGWTLAANSTSGHDARDAAGVRYQIKARRLASPSASRQLGALRRLDQPDFDVLAAVLFDENMAVIRAALLPVAVVCRQARWVAHTSSWRLMLPDATWSLPGVTDVTGPLRAAAETV